MSSPLISRSPELQRLRDEGFDLEIRDNHLMVKGVPYVTEQRTVERGTLVMALNLVADVAQSAPDHTSSFIGALPCDSFGNPLTKVVNNTDRRQIAPEIWVDHLFSSKPRRGHYSGYYEQVTTYAKLLSSHAQAIDPLVTATPFAPPTPEPEDSVFVYEDSASPRAGLSVPTARLRGQRIAIVGLGGTGAHVLDLVSKAPVAIIDLFDGDRLEQHNAFRFPGAIPLSVLREAPFKVNYLAKVYGEIHTRIKPHATMITDANVEALASYDTVFLCVDNGAVRTLISDRLAKSGTIVIDTGMGVRMNEGHEVFAIVRTTLLDKDNWNEAKATLPLNEGDPDDLYKSNAQVGALNALNAFMAVEAWKKHLGYYSSRARSYLTTYTTHSGAIGLSSGVR